MEFKEFKKLLQSHIDLTLVGVNHLFVASVDRSYMWELYLDSFPKGTNEIYRERREMECTACSRFIRDFGAVVAIKNGKIVTMWDFETEDSTYQPVVEALREFVRSAAIRDVHVTFEAKMGVDSNLEQMGDGKVVTWEHMFTKLPKRLVCTSNESVGSVMGEYNSSHSTLKRSLDELTLDAMETVLDLIFSNSLHRGEEAKGSLTKFLGFMKEYTKLETDLQKDLYCWEKAVTISPGLCRLRSQAIGTLLVDVSDEEITLTEAVYKYEDKVSGGNYKRTDAVVTKKQTEAAHKKFTELGYIDSLERRFAVIGDITVNNVLFANKDSANKITNVFEDLAEGTKVTPKDLKNIEEIGIKDFITNVLPRSSKVEILFEGRHVGNLSSLIGPKNVGCKSMSSWDNPFTWAYKGNVADSMKQRVKSLGGKVDGVLRCSIEWNFEDDDSNDLDVHCVEPNGNRIGFQTKRGHASGGNLDVDIQDPRRELSKGCTAVENITWPSIEKMQDGTYHFFVHQYAYRGGVNGFKAEIEFGGQVYQFVYAKTLKQGTKVTIAKIKFSKKDGIEFLESLSSTMGSTDVWNIKTNTFQPVYAAMYSPNYWNEQTGVGSRHYMFMIKDCKNDENPNGFYNEFMKSEMKPHRRVIEALGRKMQVPDSEEQLSGISLCSTKKDSVIIRVEGHVRRTFKVNI